MFLLGEYMRTSTSDRVAKHRANLRASGMRPIQIWVPDTRLPGFADQCKFQSSLASNADSKDEFLNAFMDEALMDLDE